MAATDITLGELGQRMLLQLVYGASYGPYRLGVTLADGTPVDLTGQTLRAEAWRKGDRFAKLLDLVAVPVAGTDGLFDLSASPAAVARLAVSEAACRKRDPLELEWALYKSDGAGSVVSRVFYGVLELYLGATP